MMSTRRLLMAGLMLLPVLAMAATNPHRTVKPVQMIPDRHTLADHLRAMGYRTHGGVDKGTSDRDEGRAGSFPHFSSSLSSHGVAYPFTMIGYPPKTGQAASIKTVIIPLRMNFVYFGSDGSVTHTFEPRPAVTNIIHSPMFASAAFPNGYGQFGDQMQRAAFWNQMDKGHNWHVRLDGASVTDTVDIEVTPEIGSLFQDSEGNWFGDVYFDFMDSLAQTILQFLNLGADTLPIFVTNGVTNEALGYHTAYTVKDSGGKSHLQTFIFTSWLDPATVDPLFADVSTFNHEIAEWLNDPFINNIVPVWAYPPPNDPSAVCSFNPFLEVGDPQGNGPTYVDFPTIPITISGVTYHLQQVVLWQWFTGEAPSNAYGGWYTFPSPASLTVPAVFCP